MRDLVVIIAITVGACLVIGLVGVVALHLLRNRSLRYQLAVATLVPVLAVAITVVLNVRLMFLSPHDSAVILVALATSLALAVSGAWLVVRRISHASRRVGAGLSQLVADSAPGPVAAHRPAAALTESDVRPAPAELAEVLQELARTRVTLAESRERERAAEESRRELVTFMSHDLRTPLAGLRALAEGLEDGVISDVPRALSHLRSTVTRMTALVDDLFALSRVQGANQPKPQRLVSLRELIDDVASETTPTAQAHGVRLEVHRPEDDRLAVLGSPDDLARAFGNLVVNAIRHTEPGASVRIEGGRAPDGHLQVAVVDGCGGIPEQHLARVFDTGWRASSSRGDDGGAGLGLAITKGVVESHAGRIGVRNVTGGCRFDISLPSPDPTLPTSGHPTPEAAQEAGPHTPAAPTR